MNTWRRIAIAAGAILLLATGTQAMQPADRSSSWSYSRVRAPRRVRRPNANLIKPTGAADVLTLSMRDAMIAAAMTAPAISNGCTRGRR
jgi:hypothetical protein